MFSLRLVHLFQVEYPTKIFSQTPLSFCASYPSLKWQSDFSVKTKAKESAKNPIFIILLYYIILLSCIYCIYYIIGLMYIIGSGKLGDLMRSMKPMEKMKTRSVFRTKPSICDGASFLAKIVNGFYPLTISAKKLHLSSKYVSERISRITVSLQFTLMFVGIEFENLANLAFLKFVSKT